MVSWPSRSIKTILVSTPGGWSHDASPAQPIRGQCCGPVTNERPASDDSWGAESGAGCRQHFVNDSLDKISGAQSSMSAPISRCSRGDVQAARNDRDCHLMSHKSNVRDIKCLYLTIDNFRHMLSSDIDIWFWHPCVTFLPGVILYIHLIKISSKSWSRWSWLQFSKKKYIRYLPKF